MKENSLEANIIWESNQSIEIESGWVFWAVSSLAQFPRGKANVHVRNIFHMCAFSPSFEFFYVFHYISGNINHKLMSHVFMYFIDLLTIASRLLPNRILISRVFRFILTKFLLILHNWRKVFFLSDNFVQLMQMLPTGLLDTDWQFCQKIRD